MDRPLPQLLLHPLLQRPRLRRTPAQDLRKQPQPIRLDRLRRRDRLPLAQLLQLGILRPGTQGHDVHHLGDILEPGVGDPPPQLRRDVHLPARLLARLVQVRQPLDVGRVVFQAAVVAPGPDGDFDDLEVAAGFEVGV